MFISLKRYLYSEELALAESLHRMVQLLLEAIRMHAVVADPAEHEKFQKDIAAFENQLNEEVTPKEILVLAGAVVKTLEEYNRQTTRFVRMQSAELQSMLAMLMETVAALSAGSDRSVARLQAIERQLERAAAVEDIRAVKAKLSECLLSLREEAQRQREEMARTISELKGQIEQAQQRRLPPRAVGRSKGRDEAEQALRLAYERGGHVYAAVFVVDRMDLVSGRFGPSVSEQLVRYFQYHLAQGLLSSDEVYRWDASSLLVLMERSYGVEQVRAEVQRVASVRLEKTIQIGTRTVLLPITSHSAVTPVFEARSLAELISDLDAVVAKCTRGAA